MAKIIKYENTEYREILFYGGFSKKWTDMTNFSIPIILDRIQTTVPNSKVLLYRDLNRGKDRQSAIIKSTLNFTTNV